MSEDLSKELAIEVAKEATKAVAKDVYSDGLKPAITSTGKVVDLLPRTIKAILSPLEIWVMQREYNLAAVQKLLEAKLESIPIEQIIPPEAYIAAPALNAISYCMDNDELRNMFANLLANSMNSAVRDGVHPGYVEMIKQMCPDEAKIMRYFSEHGNVPTISVFRHNKERLGRSIINTSYNIDYGTGHGSQPWLLPSQSRSC